MTLLLGQVSESVTMLVAGVAPLLTAIRIGPNRHTTGFLWREDLLITSDQGLPAAAHWSIVLSNGELASGRSGRRDSVYDLAAILLDRPVRAQMPPAARSTAIGALVLALGADFDGSPTVRLTTIHGFPRLSSAGGSTASITLDVSGDRVSHGGIVLDAEGRLLGMTTMAPSGDAMVVPYSVIARFAEGVPSGGGLAQAHAFAAASAAPRAGTVAPSRDPIGAAEAAPKSAPAAFVAASASASALVPGAMPLASEPAAAPMSGRASPPLTMAVAADPAPAPSRHAAGRESEGHAQAAPTQAGFGHWQGGQSHENPNGHQPYGSNGHEAPGGQRQADHASPSSGGRRGWLGVSLQPITVPDNLVHRAGQATARQVVAVTKGGPADRAGLRGGDVLLAVDRTPTTGNYALRSFLAPDRVGSQVELRVMRDGLLHTAMLTIEPQPEP